jgi:hypothetical protein
MRRKGKHLPGAELLENDDLSARVNLLLPLLDSLLHDRPRRQPRLVEVVQPLQELASRQLARLQETLEEDLVVGVLVPAGVERTNASGEVGARAVTGGGGRVVLGDAVVVAVDGLDEVGVHLEEEGVDDRRVDGLLSHGGDDLTTKVPVRGGAEERRGENGVGANVEGGRRE